jgi:hypothetical protein
LGWRCAWSDFSTYARFVTFACIRRNVGIAIIGSWRRRRIKISFCRIKREIRFIFVGDELAGKLHHRKTLAFCGGAVAVGVYQQLESDWIISFGHQERERPCTDFLVGDQVVLAWRIIGPNKLNRTKHEPFGTILTDDFAFEGHMRSRLNFILGLLWAFGLGLFLYLN